MTISTSEVKQVLELKALQVTKKHYKSAASLSLYKRRYQIMKKDSNNVTTF